MMSAAQSTDCSITELVEHRAQLIRENDKLRNVINRARIEILEIQDINGVAVLGDYELSELQNVLPVRFNKYNRDLLFRAIEILNDV